MEEEFIFSVVPENRMGVIYKIYKKKYFNLEKNVLSIKILKIEYEPLNWSELPNPFQRSSWRIPWTEELARV